MNKGRRRPEGRGLSDVLGRELKALPPLKSTTAKIFGQKTKFVLMDDILDTEIADTNVTLQKEHYRTPGSRDYLKNIAMANSPLAKRFGVASHKISVK